MSFEAGTVSQHCAVRVETTLKTRANRIALSVGKTTNKLMTFTKSIVVVAFVIASINVVKAGVIASGVCGTSNNLIWELTDDGTLTITGSGQMTNFAWESAVPWSSHRANITTIVLPNGLTNIGEFAFYQCNISSINIPNTVTVIEEYAFAECKELTSVVIPNSVETIKLAAFIYNYKLTKVVLGSSVEKLEHTVFKMCSAIDTIICKSTVPPIINSVEYTHTFELVDQLVKIIVPCGKGFDYKASAWGDKFGLSNVVEDCTPFVAVTGITLSANTIGVNTPLALNATVAPSNATNKTIVWSVANANGTGASISGSTFTATDAGTATVRATITDGKSAGSNYMQDFNITVTAEGEDGIEELQITNYELRVYPNPVNSQLRITNYEFKENDVVEIYDVVGRTLNNYQFSIVNSQLIIDVSHLVSGMYYLKLDNRVVKFVKE